MNRLVHTAMIPACVASFTIITPRDAGAQWSTAYEQHYLPGKFNWTFRKTYPAADRLFNAFDYGHAILYERLYNDPGAPKSALEEREYDFITKKLLVSPPRLPLEESAIEVNYAKIAPEAKMMFDWAHLFHRQIYDVLASERMSWAEKDSQIARLVSYYKTRGDLAFSSLPKNMTLMEGQSYSLAFRQQYPKFNGLIWGYHWLQVGLYEPLMVGKTQDERQTGVAAAVSRFRQMLINAPENMPRIMPMTAGIAPTFASRYQEAAIIFDNLHAMHDVISDILANEKVPRSAKRAAILEAASRYRDNTTFLMPIAEWATMGEMMGVANMGGPAVGVLTGWPTPTIARGASMEAAMKAMPGMAHGAPGAAHTPGMAHGTPGAAHTPGMRMPGTASKDSVAGHASMPGMAGMPAGHDMRTMPSMPMAGHDSAMVRLHERMMRDPIIRQRMMADPEMRRMMSGMRPSPGMTHDMSGMRHAPSPARTRAPRAASSARRKATSSAGKKASAAARKPSAKPPATDMKGMPGMKH